jgi:NADPH:quinone reductase-like Zn-dependent oxidoreductase
MDCVGNAPFERVGTSINPGGALLLVIADLKGILLAARQTRASGKLVTAAEVNYTAEALAFLVHLAESGELEAVIDRTYELADIVKAHRYVETGRKKGSVILKITAD